jgi:hypothetical protein
MQRKLKRLNKLLKNKQQHKENTYTDNVLFEIKCFINFVYFRNYFHFLSPTVKMRPKIEKISSNIVSITLNDNSESDEMSKVNWLYSCLPLAKKNL